MMKQPVFVASCPPLRSALAQRCLAALCLALPACSQSSAQPESDTPAYSLFIAAQTDGDEPLAGVRVSRQGVLLGSTEASGRVQLSLDGAEGDRVPLDIACPEGFVSPAEPVVVGLRHLGPGSPAPTFEVACVPLLHSFVVGLRADQGTHLPVLHLGRPVGHTDALGVAHVLVRAPRQEQVSLTLDTSSRPDLRPQNPTLTFVAPDRDELVLFEQELVALKPPAPPPRKRPRGPMPL
jgi:hypothetical protein